MSGLIKSCFVITMILILVILKILSTLLQFSEEFKNIFNQTPL